LPRTRLRRSIPCNTEISSSSRRVCAASTPISKTDGASISVSFPTLANSHVVTRSLIFVALVFVFVLVLWLAYFGYGTLLSPSQVNPPRLGPHLFTSVAVLLHPSLPPNLPARRTLHPRPLLRFISLPPNLNLPQEIPFPHKQVTPTIQPQTRPKLIILALAESPHRPLVLPAQNRPRRRRRQSRPQSARRRRGRIHRRLGNVPRGFLGGGRETAS
jgi:hypothetical protein